MGLGYWLTEECKYDPTTGALVTNSTWVKFILLHHTTSNVFLKELRYLYCTSFKNPMVSLDKRGHMTDSLNIIDASVNMAAPQVLSHIKKNNICNSVVCGKT